jgi:hypothetical protein
MGWQNIEFSTPLNVNLYFKCKMQPKQENPLQMWIYIAMQFMCLATLKVLLQPKWNFAHEIFRVGKMLV